MGLILPMTGLLCQASDSEVMGNGISSRENTLADYFMNWFSRASAIQAEQPHWITPLVTTTARLEEKFRYDLMWESLRGGQTLTNYGGGGSKGLDLIPFNPVEVSIGLPSWQTVNGKRAKNGWTDESFRIKYRLLAADEENGNYILSAFMGLTVPNGSDNTTSHHFAYSPTIAFGKGFGDFDVQGTLGISVPDNGSSRAGTGTPILSNTALQYRLLKCLWVQVETNYTYWPNGNHEALSQLFLTPSLAIGRIPIAGRVGLTVGAGCQIAVTDNPLYHRNVIIAARLPF